MDAFAVRPYRAEEARAWNDFVAQSRNGTFLFDRAYMDYHADRFPDASLIITEGERIVALLPATRRGERLASHDGLTYGGLLVGPKANAATVLGAFAAVCDHCRDIGVTTLFYKAVPFIYHRRPAQDDLYALFRHEARLVRRELLPVIEPGEIRPNERRRSYIRRAGAAHPGAVGRSQNWGGFWDVLGERLADRHGVRPVHSLDEMRLLAGRFPDAIQLIAAEVEGRVEAGIVTYETPCVLHIQYIASTPAGDEAHQLDAVIHHAQLQAQRAGKWLSFGISTTEGGRVLNEGLTFYKESFGARTIMQDSYEVSL
ncbi:GNAT family N-acetyltransferase [Ancylobacter pratisalsi]|uniref:GNAT family N-acetyltransferase n=1 Tax=Ancylobacter pratisalsi TaxID=1745854 RepID=A0A6P1YHD7_9HYPH|nr:GNAT family N-acetyltransferase [Ancylobacter pratisalsi]QIB32708.1 GNAT family N-acetyltransferase [Ancylobacter pratisalsi]